MGSLDNYDRETRHNVEMSRAHNDHDYRRKEYPEDKKREVHPLFIGLLKPFTPKNEEK